MATRLYCRDMRSTDCPPAGPLSAAIPAGGGTLTSLPFDPYQNRSLSTIRGNSRPETQYLFDSPPQTTHNEQYVACFTSKRLSAQTIAAQTWTVAVATSENNAGANSETRC